MIEIYSLVYQPAKSPNKPPYRYTRGPVESVKLIAGHGIEGDHKAGCNPKRQLNIMSYETLLILREEGFKVNPGEMGEQIVIRGLDVATLSPGSHLQLGDSAVVEIGELREPCEWFQLIQGKSLKLAEGRVGVMARVIQTGIIRVDDPVKVLELQPA
jgi:MOSC domain-containing protein YiiM